MKKLMIVHLPKQEKTKNIKLIYSENPDLNINYRTVHGSKGLEEDNVILINLERFQVSLIKKLMMKS